MPRLYSDGARRGGFLVDCDGGLSFYFFYGLVAQERVWVISIARLCALLHLHLQPIDVIVCDDPYMEILSWGGLRA